MEFPVAGEAVPALHETAMPHGVELRHLRYFVAIVEEGSMTRAARRLRIAQQSLSEMLGERGIGGNLEVIGSLFVYMAPALAWIVVAQIRRSRTPVEKEQRWTEVALVAAALAIAFTLLVSPKTGPRLYFGSCALAAVVIANIAMRQRMRMVLVAGSALVMAFVAWKCVTGYRVIGQTWAKRVAEGKHDQPIDYTPYPLPKTRWYLDDDMTLEQYRTLAAAALQSSIMPP